MRKTIFICASFFALIAGFSSCSKCYDCSHEVEIQGANGTVQKDTVTDEFCTASSEEVKQKESNGYTCVGK